MFRPDLTIAVEAATRMEARQGRQIHHKDTKAQRRQATTKEGPCSRRNGTKFFVPFRREVFVSWCLGGEYLFYLRVLVVSAVWALATSTCGREPLSTDPLV
jgi:hypothetical protein